MIVTTKTVEPGRTYVEICSRCLPLSISEVYLNLNTNRLTQLPPGTDPLKHLDTFQINSNLIDDISQFTELTNPLYLDCSDNLLQQLPTDIDSLKEFRQSQISSHYLHY